VLTRNAGDVTELWRRSIGRRLSPVAATLTAAGGQAADFLGSIIVPTFGFLGSKTTGILFLTAPFASSMAIG